MKLEIENYFDEEIDIQQLKPLLQLASIILMNSVTV